MWSANVDNDEYERLRASTHVLHAARQDGRMQLRIAHPGQPCAGAQPSEPSLEEALMAQRYAVKEAA